MRQRFRLPGGFDVRQRDTARFVHPNNSAYPYRAHPILGRKLHRSALKALRARRNRLVNFGRTCGLAPWGLAVRIN